MTLTDIAPSTVDRSESVAVPVAGNRRGLPVLPTLGGMVRPVVDVCLYNGEHHALEIRFNELTCADVHIICEGNITFQGDPKERTFQPSVGAYPHKQFIHRTFAIDNETFPFDREESLRNQAGWYAANLFPDATILLSDADEIPKNDDIALVTPLIDDGSGYVRLWSDRHFYWTLDWELTDGIFDSAPFVASSSLVTATGAQALRKGGVTRKDDLRSGWHFSFLGGPSMAIRKYRSTAHDELNRPEVLDRIDRAYREGLDPSPERGSELKPVDIDHTWPRYVLENPGWVAYNRLSRLDWA